MTRQIKVVMAQINLVVGDIEGNTNAVLHSAKLAVQEHSADMIVFPELTLTGYPPEDLLLRPSLETRISKAIERIKAAELPIVCVLGFPENSLDKLFNSLLVLDRGKELGRYQKQCLPNYQVFDEHRYFSAGTEPCVLSLFDTLISFTICEDMWEAEPVAQARRENAQLMININASPFHLNKLEQRKELLFKRSEEGGFPIVYVNLVGGQDELVFDGRSMVVQAKDELSYLAPAFVEGSYLVELAVTHSEAQKSSYGSVTVAQQSVASSLSTEAQVYHSLVLGVKDYVNKNGFSGVVLGLSGGIDSALTLAIATDALGADRVKAVMMPFEYTSQLSLSAAAEQAKTLGCEYNVIPIGEVYESFMFALEDEFKDTTMGVSEQNLQARCRGVILMAISNKKGLLVLTTGNKSEIAVGYSTLYGDMAGGFDVLKDVSKTLVYKLAVFRNSEFDDDKRQIIPQSVIDRPPSAELAPGQEDQDSLPPYDVLDAVLELYVEKDFSASAIIKMGYEEAMVKRVLRLVDLNEYKRRQSPIGVRLTQRGFGRDRRYPITNAWHIGD